MRLYELTGEWAALMDAAEAGEDVSDALAAIGDAIETKAERCFAMLRNLEADAEAIKAEESRLNARRKSAENQAKRLRDYIRDAMDAGNVHKVSAPGLLLTVSDGPEGVEVDDLDAVPDEYCTLKRVPNKTKIKAAFQQHGECVSGTRIARKRVLKVR